jgi:DNA-directed RNA polymerase
MQLKEKVISQYRQRKLLCEGLKKRDSIEERLRYADEILEDILDSANNPVTGKRWYLQSDDPWQTYSACCEIRNALAHPGGPENYVCHLPIHQVLEAPAKPRRTH